MAGNTSCFRQLLLKGCLMNIFICIYSLRLHLTTQKINLYHTLIIEVTQALGWCLGWVFNCSTRIQIPADSLSSMSRTKIKHVWFQTSLFHYWLYNTVHLHTPVYHKVGSTKTNEWSWHTILPKEGTQGYGDTTTMTQ